MGLLGEYALLTAPPRAGDQGGRHSKGDSRILQLPADHRSPLHSPVTEDEMPTSLPAFQVLLRLQYLRGQTHCWQRRGLIPDRRALELPEVLTAMQGLSVAAQTAGFVGFAKLCLRLSEQLVQSCPEGRVSNTTAQLFMTWSYNADRYLRKPSSRTLIASLASQLGATAWGSSLPAREQDRYIQEMLAPFA